MDKFKDFPEQPRHMGWDEMNKYFDNMLAQIAQFAPDEIVAVNRSGYAYGMWVAQRLKLPLGSYWPDKEMLAIRDNSTRLVFVDDNVLKGDTFNKTKSLMNNKLPDVGWRWAVLFTDWHTPNDICEEVIHGVKLPYFAEEPIPGSMKVSQDYGVRYRDE